MRQKRYSRWLLVLFSAVALLSFPSSVSADFISTGAQIIEGTRKGAEGVLMATELPEAASGMVQGAKSAYQNFTSTVSGWLGGDKKDTAQVTGSLTGSQVAGMVEGTSGLRTTLSDVQSIVTPAQSAQAVAEAVEASQASGITGAIDKVGDVAGKTLTVVNAIPVSFAKGANGDQTISSNLGVGLGNIRVQITHTPNYIMAGKGPTTFYVRAYSTRTPIPTLFNPNPIPPMLKVISLSPEYKREGLGFSPIPILDFTLYREHRDSGKYELKLIVTDVTSGETKAVFFRYLVRRGDSDLYGNNSGQNTSAGNGDEQVEEILDPGTEPSGPQAAAGIPVVPGGAPSSSPKVTAPADPPASTSGGGVSGGGFAGGGYAGGSSLPASSEAEEDVPPKPLAVSEPKGFFGRVGQGFKGLIGGVFGGGSAYPVEGAGVSIRAGNKVIIAPVTPPPVEPQIEDESGYVLYSPLSKSLARISLPKGNQKEKAEEVIPEVILEEDAPLSDEGPSFEAPMPDTQMIGQGR